MTGSSPGSKESDHHPPSGSNHPVPQSDVAPQNTAVRFQCLPNEYTARCPIPSSWTAGKHACFHLVCAHYKATKALGAVPWVPIYFGWYGRKTHVPWHAIFLHPAAHPKGRIKPVFIKRLFQLGLPHIRMQCAVIKGVDPLFLPGVLRR